MSIAIGTWSLPAGDVAVAVLARLGRAQGGIPTATATNSPRPASLASRGTFTNTSSTAAIGRCRLGGSCVHDDSRVAGGRCRSCRSDRPLGVLLAAFLGRFRCQTRAHTASDLRCFLSWCTSEQLDPLTVTRAQLELFLPWMQDTRGLKPSTVSRRFSVVAGFYRVAVIDGLLEPSPAEHVRRPVVPPKSPTLGLTHLQFEALLTAARDSANLNDFALVAMLGLRIFEATGLDIAGLGDEHGHRVLRVVGKGGKVVLVPLPPAVGRAVDRAIDGGAAKPILRTRDGTRMDRHAATRRLRRLAEQAGGAAAADAPAHPSAHLRHRHA